MKENLGHAIMSPDEELASLPGDAALLNSRQLAERLAVPPSWVKEKTRRRARIRDEDPLPIVRLGKYVRFDWPSVQAWLIRQRT